MAKNKDLGDAEAVGNLKTMPPKQDPIVEKNYEGVVVDNPEDFRMAVGHAQMAHAEYIEVSARMFEYLVKNNKTEYITYGSPGIKVYKEGTREKIEAWERLSPEQQMIQMRKTDA